MSGIVKFTEASTIALHAMAVLASESDAAFSVRELSGRLPVSANHLAKVLQRLTHAGLVEASRGPSGGFRLRRAPTEVTLLEIHEAVEGRLDVVGCLFTPARCDGTCILGDTVHRANALVYERLATTRLADAARVLNGSVTPWEADSGNS